MNDVLLPAAEVSEISVLIEDAKTGERIYELAPKVRRIPASTQKLLTTLVALRAWGDAATWETSLFETADKTALILFLNGDPSLKTVELKTLLKNLPKNGSWKSLKVIDAFPTFPEVCPSWMFEDVPSNYASPLAGAMIDSNRVSATVYPGEEVGEKTHVRLTAPYAYKNHILTGEDDTPPTINLAWEGNCLILSGYIACGSSPLIEDFSAPNVELHAHTVLEGILKAQDLNIPISYEKGSVLPANLSVIATHRSKPLNETLIPALRNSDDVYYDMIFLKLALEENLHAHSWDALADAFKAHAQRLIPELNFNDWRIADGSGLSVKNWVSAEQMMALFKAGESNPIFMGALPMPGGPGTLRYRFTNFKGKIHAKTGYMEGTATLAGLATLPTGEAWRLIVFVNQGQSDRERHFILQDSLFQAIEKGMAAQ